MKRQLILLLLLSSVFSFLKAQNYYTLPTSIFVWGEERNIMSAISYNNYFTDSMHSDTLISSRTYTKLFCDSLNNYIGAFRSDTSGKAFFVLRDSTQEYLFMDISKNAGDSVKNVLYGNSYYSQVIDFHVDSVDYPTVGPYTLKRLFISNHNYWPPNSDYSKVFWIEKIGTSNGFYNQSNYYSMGAYSIIWLNCMYYNDTTYFIWENGNGYGLCEYSPGQCTSTVGLENSVLRPGITIFPNPFSEQLVVANIRQRSILSIFSIQGQLLFEKSIGEGKTEIDVSRLAKGIYFLKIYSNNETEVLKILKE